MNERKQGLSGKKVSVISAGVSKGIMLTLITVTDTFTP